MVSSPAVVPIFSVVAASVVAAVVSSVFVVVWIVAAVVSPVLVVVWIVDLSVVEYVEYGYWQVPSFPQVPWPLHVVAGLQFTNINEKRVRGSFCVLRRKSCELSHVIYLKLTILIMVFSFPKLNDG